MRVRFAAAVAAIAVIGVFGSSTAQAPKGRIVFGVEVPASIVNVPQFIAMEQLAADGYEIERIDFQSPETMALALQNGEIDVVPTSAGTAFSAIDAGLDGQVFLGMAKADFQMVAKAALTTCESLDGMRVAIQSREGTTGVLTMKWFEQACPAARPNILIVPGSENRVAGLMADQIDASPIDTQNTMRLLQERPGEFGVVDSFSESVELLASVFYARTSWLAENKDTVMAFTKAYNDAVLAGYQDPSILLAKAQEVLPDYDPALLEVVIGSWVERQVYIPVSGVQPDSVANAIAFYSSARPYQRIAGPEDASTTEYVEGLQ